MCSNYEMASDIQCTLECIRDGDHSLLEDAIQNIKDLRRRFFDPEVDSDKWDFLEK